MKKGRTKLCRKRFLGRFKKLTVGNGKGTIGNRRQDQRQVGGKGEVPLIIIKKLKSPQTCRSPGVFFARKDECSSQGEIQKKESGGDRSISEGFLTASFGARGGASLKKQNLKPPQTGGSPGDFFASQDKNMYQDGSQKKKMGRDERIS